MKRSAPLRRLARIIRRTPLRRMNRKRLAERRAVQFGPQSALCRSLPCAICNQPPPSHPHHTIPRSRGGTDADTAPLCAHHHSRGHVVGWITLQQETGVDLRAVAARLAEGIT